MLSRAATLALLVATAAACSDSTHGGLDASDALAPDHAAPIDATADVAFDSVADASSCACSASCVTRACASVCNVDAGYCPIVHTFDLATQMPARLSVMFSMSWFGIPSSDPNGPGGDPSWGNWRWGGGCVPVNDPAMCSAFMGSSQRTIASRHRPLAGIYSSSGRDDESMHRIDLMLSTLRRPCDDGARIDAWSVQIDSIRFSSRYLSPGDPHFSNSADFAYRAYLAFLARADAGGLRNAIVPGIDTTWYFNFGASFGLATQADKLGALEDDLVDMLNIGWLHDSLVRIDGRPIVYVYTGGTASSPFISVSDWQGLLTNVRNRTGLDAYVVGGTTNASYFEVFDAISPWIELGAWNATSGATVYDHAVSWTPARMDGLLSRVDAYPGRVVWGGVAPGFDDYTEDWGACMQREIPRDDAVLDAQFDVMTAARPAHDVRGMLFETWDDFTEGSIFEPEVGIGTEKLVHLRDRIGSYFGDPTDAAGDARLDQRWTTYGQARNCSGGAAVPGPAIDLHCP